MATGLPAADCVAVPEMVEKDASRNAFEMDKEKKLLKKEIQQMSSSLRTESLPSQTPQQNYQS